MVSTKSQMLLGLPSEIMTHIFRLGSENFIFADTPKYFMDSIYRSTENGRYVLKPFAALAAQVCSEWRHLILLDSEVRFVLISNQYTGTSPPTVPKWESLLKESGRCDLQLVLNKRDQWLNFDPDLYVSQYITLDNTLNFMELNPERLTSLAINLYRTSDTLSLLLFLDQRHIIFPRLKHVNFQLEVDSADNDAGREGRVFPLEAAIVPLLQDMHLKIRRRAWRSLAPHETISTLKTLTIRLPEFHFTPVPLPEGFWTLLQANTFLRVLVVEVRYEPDLVGSEFFPESENEVHQIIKLDSLEELSLNLAIPHLGIFLTKCDFLKLGRLTITTEILEYDALPITRVNLPSLYSLTLSLNHSFQLRQISFLDAPNLTYIAIHAWDGVVYTDNDEILVSTTGLQTISLSGTCETLNRCLKSLKVSEKHHLYSLDFHYHSTSRYEFTHDHFLRNIGSASFNKVEKFVLRLPENLDVATEFSSLYARLPSLRTFELVNYHPQFKNIFAHLRPPFLPKVATLVIRCQPSSAVTPALTMKDCAALIAFVEERHKKGDRLKMIYFEGKLARRTKSRLEDLVDKIVTFFQPSAR